MSAEREEEQEVMEEEDESESSYDSDDDSSFDSEMEDEAQRLMAVLRGEESESQRLMAQLQGGSSAPTAPRVPTKSPEEKWDEFVQGIETCTNASLKVTPELVSWVSETSNVTDRPARIEKLCNDLIRASQSGFVLIHAILCREFLLLLSPQQQEQLYRAIVSKHAKTVTYWKLGSDDSTEACGIPTMALLECMSTSDWPNLTELEIRGLELHTTDQAELFLSFLKRAPKIRQFNLLGMAMNETLVATKGLFDPVVAHVETIASFDELQLCRSGVEQDKNNTLPPLVSTEALEQLLSVKVKWWRMAFDGMGFNDKHVQSIGAALKASDACKMNDLLSLQHNPRVTSRGWDSLYKVCVNKQRMGLILSDDPAWVATFDLVRPLNNLHRRLEYMKDGTYRSRDAWIEWLTVIGSLPWIGEARKLNYLWYALLEAPTLITNESILAKV